MSNGAFSKEELAEVSALIDKGLSAGQITQKMGYNDRGKIYRIEARLGKKATRLRRHPAKPKAKYSRLTEDRMRELAPILTDSEFRRVTGMSWRRSHQFWTTARKSARKSELLSNTRCTRCNSAATPFGQSSTGSRLSSSDSSQSTVVDLSLIPRSRHTAV